MKVPAIVDIRVASMNPCLGSVSFQMEVIRSFCVEELLSLRPCSVGYTSEEQWKC